MEGTKGSLPTGSLKASVQTLIVVVPPPLQSESSPLPMICSFLEILPTG